jgi:hypothetical protein
MRLDDPALEEWARRQWRENFALNECARRQWNEWARREWERRHPEPRRPRTQWGLLLLFAIGSVAMTALVLALR